MRPTWDFTVASESTSRSAISAFERLRGDLEQNLVLARGQQRQALVLAVIGVPGSGQAVGVG